MNTQLVIIGGGPGGYAPAFAAGAPSRAGPVAGVVVAVVVDFASPLTCLLKNWNTSGMAPTMPP
jgi:hypothetical protein